MPMHEWLQTTKPPTELGASAGLRWGFFLAPFLAAGFFLWQNHPKIAALVALIGLIVNGGKKVSPGFTGGFRRFSLVISASAGTVLRCLLLVPFFMFLMVPMAMLQRITGRDLLKIDLEEDVESYWGKTVSSTDYERPY
jgi:hypothetical protein